MNNNFNYTYQDMNRYNNYFFNRNNSNNNYQEINLAEAYDGFLKGNLFNDLYNQYKNYQPARLIPNNEQAELLLNVDQLTFAAHELNLYLDIYPNDTNIINLFNKYQSMANEAIEIYETKYGPLTTNFLSDNSIFSWEAYSWPWEMEEN